MGRKSMVEVRRAEIIDAMARCIVRSGLCSTSLADVADEAGMQRSAISHFLGKREEVVAAVVERSCRHYIDVVEAIVAEHPADELVPALLDELIGGDRVDPTAMVLFDETLTLAHHEADARAEIERAYRTLEHRIDEGLAAGWPAASPDRRAAVRRALVHLIDNEERFRALGFATPRHGAEQTRQAAQLLLDGLDGLAVPSPTTTDS